MQNSRPSDTAKLIARSILLASQDRKLRALVADGEAEALRRILTTSNRKEWILPLLKLPPVRWLCLGLERALLPGIITHYLARKREIERSVEKAIAEGCSQVVVLGAGYDTLAWRLHEKNPAVRFIELDHPATQKMKRQSLGEAKNLYFRPVDLVAELPSSGLEEFQSEDRATIFVLEGLTMYFPPERVAELLQDISNSTANTKHIVFTLMERDKTGSIGFRGENPFIERWLKARKEPFLWGSSREELPEFLKACQIQIDTLVDHDQLRRYQLCPRALENLPLARGEIICNASPLSK